MRQRELCIQLFRRFAQKGVAQVARSLFHGLARFVRMGAHIAGTRAEGDPLFFAAPGAVTPAMMAAVAAAIAEDMGTDVSAIRIVSMKKV